MLRPMTDARTSEPYGRISMAGARDSCPSCSPHCPQAATSQNFGCLKCLQVKCAILVNNLKNMNLYFENVNLWRYDNTSVNRSRLCDIFISVCILIKACLHATPYT
jgi:hypothetical protein